MDIKIIYENDTERAEVEAVDRGYRSDIFVVIGNKKYKIYVTTLLRLQQDVETEMDYYGYYIADPNILIVDEVTKEKISFIVEEMYKCHYFESLDNLGVC